MPVGILYPIMKIDVFKSWFSIIFSFNIRELLFFVSSYHRISLSQLYYKTNTYSNSAMHCELSFCSSTDLILLPEFVHQTEYLVAQGNKLLKTVIRLIVIPGLHGYSCRDSICKMPPSYERRVLSFYTHALLLK